MFIPKAQPSPTDPAVIDQLKSLEKKLDELTKLNDALSAKTTELEIRVRARSVFRLFIPDWHIFAALFCKAHS